MRQDSGKRVGEVVTGSAWKQWVFSVIAYLPFFTRGIQTTFLSSITGSQVPETQNGVPWTATASILGAICSAPAFCWMADRFGRKVGAVVAGAVQAVTVIILYSDENSAAILIATHALVGVSSGAIFSVLPVYVMETSQSRTRGVALSLMMFLSSSGCLVMSCFVMMVKGQSVMITMAGLVVLQLVLLFCLPETPSYFVMKEELERAKDCLSRLKCLDSSSISVSKEIDVLKGESDRAKSLGTLNLSHIFKNQLWRDTSKIGLVLLTCFTIGGSLIFLDHWKVLQIAQIAVGPETTNIVVPSIVTIGSLLCVVFIGICEQRYLLTTSFTLMAIGLGVLGVFMQSTGTPNLAWLPISALLVTVFGWSLAWGLPFVVLAEALNLEVRMSVISAVFIYSQILYLVHVHTFEYLERYIGIHALCYIFSGINMYGCVYSLFGVPETKRRTVRSIEKQMKRIPPWEM